jgi:hypothetical protein
MYENRNYLIIPVTEISKVDFNQVCETSDETVRKSIDETKTFIKWDDQEPSFINELEGTEGPYNHEEILVILSTEEWSGNGFNTLST